MQKGKKEKDPVCGKEVDPAHCSCKAKHNQKDYNFCCKGCQDTFNKNPDKYSK